MMQPRPSLSAGMRWVQPEVSRAIERARNLVENHVEEGTAPALLQDGVAALREVAGIARVVRCSGVAIAAMHALEAMEALSREQIEDVTGCAPALVSLLVQLDDYCDALASGFPDQPLVLHPAINELRIARGLPVLPESEIFALQMADRGLNLPFDGPLPDAAPAQRIARRYEPTYQQSLVEWMRNGTRQGVGRVGKLAEAMADGSSTATDHTLWRCVAASAETVLSGGFGDDVSADVRRLLGRSGVAVKHVAAGASVPDGQHLAGALMLHLGRLESPGRRARELIEALELHRLLPDAQAIARLRARLRGTNTALIEQLSRELRKDLQSVKNHIDLHLRAGAGDLDAARGGLNQIAHTLAMLGLPQLARMARNQMSQLASLVDEDAAADHSGWLDIAAALLRIEVSLDDALARQHAPPPDSDGDSADTWEEIPNVSDLHSAEQALLRESQVNLGRLKAAVDHYLRHEDDAGLDEGARQVREVASALRMLRLGRAADVLGELATVVESEGLQSLCDQPGRAEPFADAIAAAEFMVESLLAGRRPESHLLETIEMRIGALAPDPQAAMLDTDEPAEAAGTVPEAAVQVAATEVAADDIDPDIRQVFIDEAAEVQETMQAALARWKRDSDDHDAMLEIRRAFHTLKGSGRMVQAEDVGEYAWACEQLLNACRDGWREPSPGIIAFIEEAVAYTPTLVSDWAEGRSVDREQVHALIARAETLRQEGEGGDEGDSLRAVFSEDALAQLGLVGRWLSAPERGETRVPPDVTRAFHTLRGASAAVGLPRFSEAVGAAEDHLAAVHRRGAAVSGEAAVILRAMVQALRDGMEGHEAEPDAEQLAQWQEGLRALTVALPRPLQDGDGEPSERHVQACMRVLDEVDGMEAVARSLRDGQPWGEAAERLCQKAQRLATVANEALPAAQAGSIVPVAQRLAQRLEDKVPMPAPGALDAFVEDLYQQLDAVREGAAPDAAPLLEQVDAVAPARAAAGMPLPEAAAPPAAPIDAPVAEAGDASALDDELRDIFVTEAQELLESIDSALDSLDRHPDSADALGDLARLLHTLKGSARVAGFTDIGEVAHRCETLIAEVDGHSVPADAGTRARLHNACDGLFRAIDMLRADRQPNLSALLEDLETDSGPPSAGPEPEPEPIAESPAEAPVLPDPIPGEAEALEPPISAAPPPAPSWPDAPAAAAGVAADDDPPTTMPSAVPAAAFGQPGADAEQEGGQDAFSAETLAAFHEESADLLDMVERMLERWEKDTDSGVPVAESGASTDLRRALHTLKGSARMVDQMSMGTAAHEMESLADDLLAGNIDADRSTFLQLHTRLEQMRTLHDAMAAAGPLPSDESDDDSTFFDSADIDGLGVEMPGPEPGASPASMVAQEAATPTEWDARVLWQPEADEEGQLGLRRELARVPVPTLESLLNQAGEVSVLRARLDQQANAIGTQIAELGETIGRLRDQLRQLDAETEAQIAARGLGATPAADEPEDRYHQDFDPLEMDRYTRMQELSRALAESVGDLEVLQGSQRALLTESEALLLQQQRITSDLQQGLMGTLMVPFARQIPRLQRVLRQVGLESGKQVLWQFEGEDIEVDRNVLERMTAPLEHVLRNAVVHGIESADGRIAAGKDPRGRVDVSLVREGQQLRLTIADDGRGLDFAAIRDTAIARGLMNAQAELTQQQLALFILEPGFSTARELTQTAGRGVGMDVLAAEVRQLGGALDIESEPGKGTRFIIHLPITLGLTQALLFVAGETQFAAPLAGIRGVTRVPQALAIDGGDLDYGGERYRVAFVADYLDVPRRTDPDSRALPAVLVRLPEGVGDGFRHMALIVDQVIGNREVVSKTIGPTVASVPGMSGATILPDGSVVLLVDLVTLVGDRIRRRRIAEVPPDAAVAARLRPTVMVVDDSITMRRVAERLLTRNGYDVLLARDGVDAMGQLATARPDVVLLDIEMPRADGFEVATYMRHSAALRDTPIIMITSRSGDKHRERAKRIGVQRYVIKPYQEAELLATIRELRGEGATA